MEKATINIKNNKITYYQSEGDGQTIVLVHGNSSSAAVFKKQMDGEPGRNFKTFALDLPGHGDSPTPDDPERTYSIEGFTNLLVAFIRKLNLEDTVLVGHSLGGHLVLESLLQLPDVKGACIFGTPPVGEPVEFEKMFLPSPAGPLITKEDLSEDEVNLWEAEGLHTCSPSLAVVKDDIKKTDKRFRRFLGQSFVAGKFCNESAIISELEIPIAVFHGESDRLVNFNYIKALSFKNLWRKAIHIIKNSGHYPHIENTEAFNTLLTAFMKQF